MRSATRRRDYLFGSNNDACPTGALADVAGELDTTVTTGFGSGFCSR